YLSVQSNRMNEIMKTLTLMSTVMLPLTFIAGVYGMNFKTMPETDWLYGYPMAVALMALVAIGIMMWFRHKGWIGKAARGDTLTVANARPKRDKRKPNGKPKKKDLGMAAASVPTHELPKINLDTLE
nr:hypothetical protein [Deltaproteobacteria bacterium]